MVRELCEAAKGLAGPFVGEVIQSHLALCCWWLKGWSRSPYGRIAHACSSSRLSCWADLNQCCGPAQALDGGHEVCPGSRDCGSPWSHRAWHRRVHIRPLRVRSSLLCDHGDNRASLGARSRYAPLLCGLPLQGADLGAQQRSVLSAPKRHCVAFRYTLVLRRDVTPKCVTSGLF